jgi:hypothetical protein
MAMKMITELCGTMPKMDRSQRNFGNVDRRIGLWDAIEETIE